MKSCISVLFQASSLPRSGPPRFPSFPFIVLDIVTATPSSRISAAWPSPIYKQHHQFSTFFLIPHLLGSSLPKACHGLSCASCATSTRATPWGNAGTCHQRKGPEPCITPTSVSGLPCLSSCSHQMLWSFPSPSLSRSPSNS